jgi:phosphomannomutase
VTSGTIGEHPQAPVRLSVVIPAFREQARIAATIAALRSAWHDAVTDGVLEIVVVDDGSPDATASEAASAGADTVIRLPVNRGKGAAVRAGVLASHGDTVAFTDADLSYHPSELLRLVAEAERGCEVVIGNRHSGRSGAASGWLRRLSHWAFQPLTHLVLAGDYRDTQCGLKAFRVDAARRLFSLGRLDSFAFDVELLLLAERLGVRVCEVPVEVVGAGNSSVHLGADALRMVGDVLRLRRWAHADVYGTSGRLPAAMGTLETVFKAYDIRGTYPDQLDADLCRRIGTAFAAFAGASRLIVARDMRPSGVELAAAFTEGVTATGTDVVDIGLASTDLLYYAAGALDAPGAMFTASHNPAQYNGIKLCLAGARPVGEDSGLADIKAAVAGDRGSPVSGRARGSVTRRDLIDDYAAHVRSFVDVGALRPLTVVADTANGMGGLVVPRVFDGLPFALEILYAELDGTFPNHPADPIQPDNLVDLQKRVLEAGADIGLAFDGDADRVFLVDERAQTLSGSLTTAMVAAAMLEKHPGATIVYNLICSKAVPEIIRERGGVPVRTRVGHSFVKSVMAETGAAFGGEHSGHYYFQDNYRADSGLIAALVVLEVLSKASAPLSELREPFERYADSGEINTTVDDPTAVIERVGRAYEGITGVTIDRLDGLTVDLGDWWFNLRPSNTEPLLRLNLESPTPPETAAHVAEVLVHLKGA